MLGRIRSHLAVAAASVRLIMAPRRLLRRPAAAPAPVSPGAWLADPCAGRAVPASPGFRFAGAAAVLGAIMVVGVATAPSTAAAQCSTGCQPPPAPPPPPLPPVGPPPPGSTDPGGWPPFGGNFNVNVNVGASASAAARAGARAGAIVVVGGGGNSYSVAPSYPTTIQGLSVQGGGSVVQVPYSASRRIEQRVVLQAVCIDDRNVPHPASQVRPDREISGGYEGELFRCIAGSRLQWTVAGEGAGETTNCQKREALWHGAGGQLVCRPEKPERDCNERSLLRRYGAGVKVLTMVREETYTAYREEVVESAGSSIMLDGGVGGRVF